MFPDLTVDKKTKKLKKPLKSVGQRMSENRARLVAEKAAIDALVNSYKKGG